MPASHQRDEPSPTGGCERVLDYEFHDPSHLRAALTHSSGADHRLGSNERLEFLGDSILGAVVCDLLYHLYPEAEEGELTRIKSQVVSRRTCAKISRRLGLDRFLILGKGMEGAGPPPHSLLADVFESLVGAIYLDGGMPAARRFITRHVRPEIEAVVEGEGTANHKSQLQQLAQRQFGATPTYPLLDEKGPDHSKCFKISAQIGTRRFVAAWGQTKKDAEQRAALNALAEISGEPVPYGTD